MIPGGRRYAILGQQAAQRFCHPTARWTEAIAWQTSPHDHIILYCIIVAGIMKQEFIKFLLIFCFPRMKYADTERSAIR